MRKKIVLFFPFLEEGKDFHWPPVSLLALGAVFKKDGFEVCIIDERVEPTADEILRRELRDALCLGITAFTGFSLGRSVRIARICREVSAALPIIWGGPHVTALPEQSKKSSLVDDVVEGYGELEFLEKVKKIAAGEDYKFFFVDKNLFFKKLMSIDMPPIPYDCIDFKKYVNPTTKASIYLTSYGCPGQCTFCSTKTLRRWVPLSLIKVKKDIDNLFVAYPFKQIVFYDATFFVDLERAMEIVKYIQKYDVSWLSDARTYEVALFDKNIIEQLEDSLLKSITIGLETGSKHVIKIFNKGEGHIERMYKIINNFKDSPININSGIIFGSPGETIEDLKATLKIVKELKSIKKILKLAPLFLGRCQELHFMICWSVIIILNFLKALKNGQCRGRIHTINIMNLWIHHGLTGEPPKNTIGFIRIFGKRTVPFLCLGQKC